MTSSTMARRRCACALFYCCRCSEPATLERDSVAAVVADAEDDRDPRALARRGNDGSRRADLPALPSPRLGSRDHLRDPNGDPIDC